MKKTMYYQSTYASPVGMLTLASDGEALVGVWIKEQKYFPDHVDEMPVKDELPIFKETKKWLDRYFAGEKPEITQLDLKPQGSEFRQKVWKILREIPYGEIITYGEIAKKLGSGCAQAVGGAVGHNPISIIIPCHRVIGADGSLTGYAGGIDKKVFLLKLEGVL